MFGVSPAYFISRFTDRFTPEDVAAGLPDLAAAGFDAFQLEVFHPETLGDWCDRGFALVRQAAAEVGLAGSQFVGHFLLHGFEDPTSLESDFGIDETRRVLTALQPWSECRVFTLALPAFRATAGSGASAVSAGGYRRLWGRFVEKIERILGLVEGAGWRIAFEVMPGSILGGTAGLLRLADQLASPTLGYNFDTGHAWAAREPVGLIPAILGSRILGTHLKDIAQGELLAIAPGRGRVPWDQVVAGLLASGYAGSWDVEIRCDPGDVAAEYAAGLAFIKKQVEAAGVAAIKKA